MGVPCVGASKVHSLVTTNELLAFKKRLAEAAGTMGPLLRCSIRRMASGRMYQSRHASFLVKGSHSKYDSKLDAKLLSILRDRRRSLTSSLMRRDALCQGV